MKIYTGKGDKGKTGTLSGKLVFKDQPLPTALGELDELNSLLGVVSCETANYLEQEPSAELKSLLKWLSRIQRELMDLSGDLAAFSATHKSRVKVKNQAINKKNIKELELEMDKLQNALPRLKVFILPGGHKIAAYLHLARAVCRRAERSLVSLVKESKDEYLPLIYLNRLSDILFLYARFINYFFKETDTK